VSYEDEMLERIARVEQLAHALGQIETAVLHGLRIDESHLNDDGDAAYRFRRALEPNEVYKRLAGSKASNTNAAIMYGIAALVELLSKAQARQSKSPPVVQMRWPAPPEHSP
jgi:hypothetical protein